MNKRKLTDYSVLAPDTPTKLKKQQKNLLGYLKYCYIGHSEYRYNNDDWFYVSNTELLKETGIGSKQTLYVYLNLFIEDGIIEKLTGDRHHANMYRFTSNYTDHRHDYKPIQNRTTRQTDNEQIIEKSVLPNEVESVLPDFEQNRTTDKDTDKEKEKECTNNECLFINSSTSNISTFNDEFETDNKLKQDLIMEEKLNDTKWDEKKFQEMNERKKVIMASIEKFIAASPTLSDDKVKEYIELYSAKLREVYYRQDYANNAIAMMVSRIAKFRAKGTAPVTTKNGVEMKKPPVWIVDELVKQAKEYQGTITQEMCKLIQGINQQLKRDYTNTEYKDFVEGYKNWYFKYILDNYTLKLVEYCNNSNTEIQVKEIIKNAWNKECVRFQVELNNF